METYEVMRTTFAARDYQDVAVSDETLYRILDHARFAPSGGNRQGWRVLVIRERELRRQLKDLLPPTLKQYKAQAMAGETPFNTVIPSQVDDATIAAMSADFPLVDDLETAPVVLVVAVDLSLVSAFDRELPRVAVVPGASIYPFVWNILLAARNEGLGGVLTTFLARHEDAVRDLLKLPDHFAVAAMIGMGKPVKQLTRLKRHPVEDFCRIDTWEGAPLGD